MNIQKTIDGKIIIMRELPDYPKYYACDNGEIFSMVRGPGKYLSKHLHRGYYRVKINGNPQHLRSLIASAWLSKYYNKDMYLKSLDGDVTNTEPMNLRYCMIFEDNDKFEEWYKAHPHEREHTPFEYKGTFFESMGEYGERCYPTTEFGYFCPKRLNCKKLSSKYSAPLI